MEYIIMNTFTLILFSIIINNIIIVNSSQNFNDIFQVGCAPPNQIITQGDQTSVTLDSPSGCGFESKKKYLFGKVSAQLKLVPGDSAGTVTTFYMVSPDASTRDEVDFEFLGNVPGETYIVQTNLYVNGNGGREQKHHLWFDPTVDFHTYSFLWNHHSILFLVDDIPIREFESNEQKGVPYPNTRAMAIHGSLWDGSSWATEGGTVKANRSHAPFVATYRSWAMDACELSPDEKVDPVVKCGKPGQFWWDKPVAEEVDKHRKRQIKWNRRHFLVYDYCGDVARFPQGMPKECQT